MLIELEDLCDRRFVFDCDQTLIRGDLGEATYRLALARRWVISHDAWWSHLDEGEIGTSAERRAWRVAYERSAVERLAEGRDDFELDTLGSELWAASEALCQIDVRFGYLYVARCVYQRTPHEVSQLAELALRSDEQVAERPKLRHFVSDLQQGGGEVWVVSSSQSEVVRSIARRYMIPLSQVVGIDFKLDAAGRYTDAVIEPLPINEQKVDAFEAALQSHFGRDVSLGAELMVGDSRYDLPMMRYAKRALFIDHQHNLSLTKVAQSLGAQILASRCFDD